MTTSPTFTNRLQHETSPYLRQHAHNPVDWYAWGSEALDKATYEDKPILVSIGYATCHWCHVMERESFEDERIAAYMNEYFVNIKIDREERPDLDHIYMEAVQAISGHGGWPLNCFLTPDGRPFFGGTYYPPKSAHGRPSWAQVLSRIAHSFYNKREVVEDQANRLTDLVRQADRRFVEQVGAGDAPAFSFGRVENVFYALRDRFDLLEGGFGGAPKFPNTMTLDYLLRYHYYTQHPEALVHVRLSLSKMIQGGIYDQLGGGFARYATDRAWLIPHFEKMLYDNALIVSLLSRAYQYTRDPLYRDTIEETLTYIRREMTHPEGGFYAAQDADSEGEEGKYYVWTKAEIGAILNKADSELFCAFYGITDEGNWEGVNILWRADDYEAFAAKHHLSADTLRQQLAAMRQTLFAVRNQRSKPLLDDKILLDWNALMIAAYARAYAALGNPEYLTAAQQALRFIDKHLRQPNSGALYHTCKDGVARYAAFLNDYAYLIEALLEVYFVSFDMAYLHQAIAYTDYVIGEFWDETEQLFWFTSAKQTDVILRKKDIYDAAVPSGNSVMLRNLQRVGTLTGNSRYQAMADAALANTAAAVEAHPSSFAGWACEWLPKVFGIREIAVVGDHAQAMANKLLTIYIPDSVMAVATTPNNTLPLLANRYVADHTYIYSCKNYVCELPLDSIAAFEAHLAQAVYPKH